MVRSKTVMELVDGRYILPKTVDGNTSNEEKGTST